MIVPWNAPAVLLIRSLAPALAAGCTAVVKPAAQTALVSAAMIRTLHEADGLPDGVVNLLSETGADVASFLVESPDVEVISFTGSNQVGQKIMAAADAAIEKDDLEGSRAAWCSTTPMSRPWRMRWRVQRPSFRDSNARPRAACSSMHPAMKR